MVLGRPSEERWNEGGKEGGGEVLCRCVETNRTYQTYLLIFITRTFQVLIKCYGIVAIK